MTPGSSLTNLRTVSRPTAQIVFSSVTAASHAISGSASHADENSDVVAANYQTRTQGV